MFLFGAVFLIAAFLFQQSKENKKQLRLQSMKSIALTKQNFLETFDNYHGQLDSYLRRYFYSKISGEDDPAKRMVEIFDQEKRFKISRIELMQESELRGNYVDTVRIYLHQSDSTLIIEENHMFELDYGSLNYTSADSLKKLIEILKVDPNFNFVGNWEDAGTSRTFKVTHAIDMYELMKHNLNDDFFDAIYITDSSGTILYPSKAIGLDLFHPQLSRGNISSSVDPDGEGENGTFSEVGNRHFRLNISSVDQEIFSTKLKLGSQDLYMLGAKESEHFSKVALRIDFNLLSAFIIGLFLILSSIPILSIIKLDTGDTLSRAKVYGVGLSLIMLTLILGFSISFIRHQSQAKGYPEKIFRIEKDFIAQIAPFLHILEDEAPNEGSFVHLTNELIEFDSNGMIVGMKLNSLRDSLHFDKPFVSIAKRDYVQNVLEGKLSPKSFISAHYSQGTGRLEGVISKNLPGSKGKALTFKLDSLLKTSRKDERFFIFKTDGKIIFHSDKIKISVSNLEEAIGEKKWTEINTLLTNNQHYSADSITWKIPLYVNGYEYGGILTQINMDHFDQPLWVLFLVDKSLQHAKTSLSAIEASAFFIAYFSLLILLSFLNSLANKQSIYLNIKSFSYSWLGPSSGKRNQFIILNYILFFNIIGFIIIYNLVKMDIFAVFLFSTLFAIHASLSKFILIFPKQHQRMSNAGFNFILPAILLFLSNFVILGYYLGISSRPIPFFVVLILITQLILLGWIFKREFSKARTKTINFNFFPLQKVFYRRFSKVWYRISRVNDDKRIFAISFTLWTVLIGLIPGYVIHRTITHHEDYIWNQSQNSVNYIPQNLHPDFESLISKYEEIRRTSFSEIIDQDEKWINNFLAPDQAVIENSFSRENVYQLNGNGDYSWLPPATGLGFNQDLFNKIQILGTMILLLFLFILVVFLTQRIFLTEYLFTHSRYRLPEACQYSLKNFIISIDNQVGVNWILYQFKLQPEDIFLYDFIEHPQLEDLKLIDWKKVVILQNIHCCKNVFELNAPLLELFYHYNSSQKPLFITSGSSLKDLMSNSKDSHEKLIFSEVFAGFISYTITINFQKRVFKLPYASLPMEEMEMVEKMQFSKSKESPLFTDSKVKILENEVNYGSNSQQLSAIITEEISRDPLDSKMSQERFEKSLLTIQRHNKGFYINIWNELDQKERKMVYYFAQEGFINFTNRDTLTDLIQKGIFTLNVNEDGLVLFSRSFRNFVILIITEREIRIFKEDERRHGNVANIRTAAFSFIFLSIALISYYDPSVLNKTSAYVSGVIGLIGTITGLLSKGIGSLNWGKKEENA